MEFQIEAKHEIPQDMSDLKMKRQFSSFPGHFLIFLTAVSLTMTGIALFATTPAGAGVSADAARYMSTAENVLRGRGFVDYSRYPFVWWPPLYPILLAEISGLTRTDVFFIGWLLNVILEGVNIGLTGILLYHIFRDTIWTYFGVGIFATSVGLLKLSTNVGSDSLFITFILAFLIGLGLWDGTSRRHLVWLCVLAALASLQRYAGVTLAASLAVSILFKSREDIRKRFKAALMSAVGAMLPLGLWIVGHNYLVYDTLFGPRDYASMPWNNLVNSMENILNWFYPFYTVQAKFPYFHLIGFVFLAGILIQLNKKENWLDWLKAISASFVFPGVVFMLIYLITLIFTINYYEHRFPRYDRFEVVILPALLPLIFISLEYLVPPKVKARTGIIIFLFIVWLSYPVRDLYQYAMISHENGVSANNIYNLPSVRNSPSTKKAMELMLVDPQATLFSNNPAAVWFVARHDVFMPPFWEKKRKFDEAAKQQLRGWPGEGEAYLIWFIPDNFEIFATPQELSLIADVELVYRTTDGEIYHVRPLKK